MLSLLLDMTFSIVQFNVYFNNLPTFPLQVDLEDIAGSVKYHNKTRCTFFLFPGTHKSYIYIIL